MASTSTLKTEARKPLFAYVGAVDLAVAKTRELPETVKSLQTKATTFAPKVTSTVFELPAKGKELPARIKGFRGELKTSSAKYTGKATAVYGELVERGEKLVTSIRKQKATENAAAAVKSAKSRAKAATTSATKAVKATSEAVADAAEKVG